MKLKYINRIRANIAINTNVKTANILDGMYKSIHRGKSLNFENLREYTTNDDIKDIDWKASSRSGELLVKQFIAEKKHNIMLVLDNSNAMSANANDEEFKKQIAIYLAGTIGYLAVENGDYFGSIFMDNDSTCLEPFKFDLYSVERCLSKYEKAATQNKSLIDVVNYLYKNVKKHMIIFIITDIDGVNRLNDQIVRRLTVAHDVMVLCVNDASMYGDRPSFNLEDNKYFAKMFTRDQELARVEHETRYHILKTEQKRLLKNRVDLIMIDNISEISKKIIELLERHKHVV